MKATIGLALALVLSAVTSVRAEEQTDRPAPGDYRIGVEDVLHVSVWGESAIDLSVPVRPDGKISIPLVNDIEVAGKSVDAVRKEIQERLAAYIRDPAVTVIVEEINSFRVFVLGDVNNQGVFTFRRPTRLLQALAAAGGLTEYSKKELVLSRTLYGVQQVLEIDLRRLLQGEDMSQNVYLKPEDTILVN